MSSDPLQPHRAYVEEIRELEPRDPEVFDRVSFTLDAVRALAPRPITVAVYRRDAGFHVSAVRDWRRGADAKWVILGVPSHASRARIAHILADLAGVTDTPYALDLLVNAGRDTA